MTSPPGSFRYFRIVLLLLYPILIYSGVLGAFSSCLPILLALTYLPAVATWVRVRHWPARRSWLTLVILALGVLALWPLLQTQVFHLALPALISGFFLWAFGSSLRGGQPLVERIARRQVPTLSPSEVRYCRTVTQVWCLFLALNTLTVLALAVWASLQAWVLYTGLIAYILIGALFAVELTIRKYRFRRYGDSVLDRLFMRIFPSNEAAR